jgi:DNA-binding beta-propeller fold protein YncE
MRSRQWLRAPFLLLIAGLAIGAYSSLTFTHLAGSPGGSGQEDGLGAAARFSEPSWVASDAAGNLYVSDTINATVRKILPTGEVRTLAGLAGTRDTNDGFGAHARLWSPAGIALDSSGNVYVVDNHLNTIKKITPAGTQSTFSGTSQIAGYAEGDVFSARYNFPNGIAVDSSNNLYVTEYGGGAARIRKITPGGIASTFAGGPSQGWADGTGGAALFKNPAGIAYDASTNSLLVADYGDHVIRRITIPGAVVTTIAGTHGTPGHTNLNGTSGQLNSPLGIAVDSTGRAWITEASNRVRGLSATGDLSDIAGGSAGSADGAGAAARFDGPSGLTVNPADNKVYVCDQRNHTIRKIDGANVTTFAGMATGYGFTNGTGTAARFDHPSNMAYYPGPSGIDIYVADRDNNAIRKVTAPGGVVTTFAGSGTPAYANGNGVAASFNAPEGVVVDFGTGTVYVADSNNNVIRKITSTGDVTLYAGNPASSGITNGDRLAAAKFSHPTALAIYAGKMYVADGYNYRLRVINMGTGVVSDVIDSASGNPVGFSTIPQSLTVDGSGTLSWGDVAIVFKLTQSGVRSIFAGSGQFSQAPSPYDGHGSAAGFAYPGPPGVALDSGGNGYVADGNAYCVRSLNNTADVVTVGGKLAEAGSADGTGSAARFMFPRAAMLYSNGVIVSDQASLRLGLTAIADVATIDSAYGALGTSRQLSTSPNTATSWQWSIVRKPAGSSTTLSSTTIRNPTFTPDVADLYIFRCVATSATGSSITLVSLQGTGPATGIAVAYPGPRQAGTSFSVNVQAVDAFGNDAADFTGTVHFTSASDPGATLPPDHTFTLAEHGYADVSGFTFTHAGIQSITATVVGGGMSGSTGFNVFAGPASTFQVVAPATARGGTPFNVTVTARDTYGNTATSVTGRTIHFTSSDGAATLPSNYTFVSGDGGTKQFSVTLRTGGLRTITATDTIAPSMTGSAATTVQLQNLLGDQNQDGNSDIYWRNYTTSANAVWLMNGTSYTSTVNLPALPATSYRIAGIADFDADGQPDILWRNGSTGANAIWIMQGAVVASVANLPALANPDYTIGGTGDFNGDGKPDILWRNGVSGANAIWLMNGTSYTSTSNLPALPNPDYHIEGSADFSGDGKPDIVWRNWVNGANALWLMNGTSFSSVVNLPALPDPQYHIGAVADFNADTHPDLVWRHQTSGANAVWTMNGTNIVTTVNLPALPNSSYEMGGPK